MAMSSAKAARSKTLELEIDIPIYDFGQSKVALAEQTYMQAANKLAEKAVNIRSEAREAYTAYRATYDITRQYQTNVLPLRKIIQDQSLLQYSGMLNDVTDLIVGCPRPHPLECRRDQCPPRFLDRPYRLQARPDRRRGRGRRSRRRDAAAAAMRRRIEPTEELHDMTSLSRRGFIGSSGLVLAGAAAVSGRTAFAAVPEAPTMTEAATQAPLVPTSGPTTSRSRR
jgi:hypothetical protein